MKNQQVRVIAGGLRGSKLPVPLNIDGLRPTPNRVKETLFNWLMPVIASSRCLDLFAGTGGLGIEAISRGAQHVTFVESHVQLAASLLQQLQRLKVTNATVHQQDAVAFLQQTPTCAFDIVFIDPPFALDLWETVAILLDKGWLTPHAWVYTESPTQQEMTLPSNWQLWRDLQAGEVYAMLWRLI